MCESDRRFSNHIYADIDATANRGPTQNADANCERNCSLTHSPHTQLVTQATLAQPDDDEDLMACSDNGIAVENIYECGPSPRANARMQIDDPTRNSKESLSSETNAKTHNFFSTLSKSLRNKLKQRTNLPIDTIAPSSATPSEEINTETADSSTNAESDSPKAHSTFGDRLRHKFRKLNFVRNRADADDEVSSTLQMMSWCTHPARIALYQFTAKHQMLNLE